MKCFLVTIGKKSCYGYFRLLSLNFPILELMFFCCRAKRKGSAFLFLRRFYIFLIFNSFFFRYGCIFLLSQNVAGRLSSFYPSLFVSDVRHILCADHPLSRECLFLEEAGYRNRTIIRYKCRWFVMSVLVSIVIQCK